MSESTKPQVHFAPLPAGEIVRCHRSPAGGLFVTVDSAQLILACASTDACPLCGYWTCRCKGGAR